jgi:hypothetical protein
MLVSDWRLGACLPPYSNTIPVSVGSDILV